MPFIQGIDIREGVGETVFIKFEAWNLTTGDLAKDAIRNQVAIGHDCLLLTSPPAHAAVDRFWSQGNRDLQPWGPYPALYYAITTIVIGRIGGHQLSA